MFGVLAVAANAFALPTLEYEGSFLVPRVNPDFYDAQTIVVVPDGHTRPGGGAVAGPTIVMGHRQGGAPGAYELQIPALKTAGPLNSATLVPGVSGGTEFPGHSLGPTCIGSAGNFWRAKGGVWHDTDGLLSAPDDGDGGTADYTLGTSATVSPSVVEGDWLPENRFDYDGTIRRGDAAGNSLPTDGTADGATFLMNHDGSSGTYTAGVFQCVRNGVGGPMTSQVELFHPRKPSTSWRDGAFKLDYMRDTAGDEWFVLALPDDTPWDGTNHHYDLYFYQGDLADGGEYDPDPMSAKAGGFTVDVGPLVDAGAGWRHTTHTKVTDFAVDWENSQLYLIDTWTDSRIHVFTLEGEAAEPIPEPGFAGLLLFGAGALLRKRRAA